jgi:hypothetical protein
MTTPPSLPTRRTRRTITGLLSAVALTAVLGAACSSDSDTDAGADGADSTTSTEVEEGSLPDGAEDLVGRWAHFDAVSYQDDTMKTVIISTGLADLELRDGELWNSMTFCHAEVSSDQGIEVTIADAATQAIIPVDTPVEVTSVDGTLRVVRPQTPTPIGIRMDDPANESLPTDPTDPRFFDADGDGNPGITSSIKVGDGLQGDVYLARREIFTYDVTQVDPDRLEGTIVDASEQLVLGASNEIFLATAQWEQIDDPERNPVIWVRVDDDLDCDGLAAQRDELFPPNPQADW